MRFRWKTAALAGLVVLCVGAGSFAAARAASGASANGPQAANCNLGNADGQVKHVIYLQFDNTHFRRDNPSVASDLEQMPNLLNFLKQGTLFTNDHTILISHTAGGITSSLTGLYPDRMGQTVSNSYDFFQNGQPNYHGSSFQYWTSPVNNPGDLLPNMITDGQKNTPAPWVPFTRAGCDVGGVGTANIELENNTTDVTNVYGASSPEAAEPSQQKLTDFVGIAIHCSQSSQSVCHNDANAKADALPDEPGGYSGYQALFGAKYVDPAIAPSTTGNCVPDTEKAAGVAGGADVTDAIGNCGFPGFDGMFATNSLGYVEQMQEAGVPVTYAYISDAHDLHTPNTSTDSYSSSATGPGEASHNAQLAEYNQAFGDFFSNLAKHGINKSNTLFIVTVDEGDHFAGGIGAPDGSGGLTYSHTTCTELASCPTNQIGEVDTNMTKVLPAGEPGFDIHFDDAPAFYVDGQPGRDDPNVRKLEQDVGDLTSLDPYVRNSAGQVQTVKLTENLADPVEMQTLHMVNTDPNRTPTFVDFGNDDFYFQESNCSGAVECASPGYAWNHGDDQSVIGNTWVGFVGPGVASNGVDSATWTDHTNVRPTILALTGLKDDYVDDGHVLVQALTGRATPQGLGGIGRDHSIADLEVEDDLLNSPFGTFGTATLHASTYALESTDDAVYNQVESEIQTLTQARDKLAGAIRQELYGAAFDRRPINPLTAQLEIAQAKDLIAQAAALPSN